jgi:hypothetical protein
MNGGTPPRYPKGMPRKHHFVPRGYLAGFCAEGTERFALFDRARAGYRDRQAPAEVAHIRDYYAFDVGNGEVHFDIEASLSKLESDALPIIRKIDSDEGISNDERFVLALYAAFQHTRTPVFQHTVDGIGSHMVTRIAQMLQSENAFPEEKREVTPEQFAEIAQRLGIEVKREASLQMMLNMSPEIAHTLNAMDWTIVRRPDTKQSFVTTDSPFCLVPGPDYVSDHFRGIGLKTLGILKVLPLSQASTLVISEPGGATASYVTTRDGVRQINQAVAVQCQNFLFGRDLALIKSVVASTGIDKAKWRSGWNFD